MIFFFGTRLYGRINRCDGTFTATLFFHLFFLPLIPLKSMLVVGESARTTTTQGIPFLAMSTSSSSSISGMQLESIAWKSVALGYLRTWWILVDMFAALAGLIAMDMPGGRPAVALFIVLLALHPVLILAGRNLGGEKAAQHRIYAKFLGAPIDPLAVDATLFDGTRREIIAFLKTKVKPGIDSATEYVRAAGESSDPAILGAGLTLARIDEARDPRMANAHRALWQRLRR